MLRRILVVSLLATLAACGDDPAVQRSTLTGPSTTSQAPSFQGRVLDAGTSAVVVGAAVTLQGKSTITDLGGLFTLRDLTVGPLRLRSLTRST